MAPIDLRLGQNAFQVIPELSLFDIEDGKIFGFFGLDQFVLAGTHVSWPRHMCFGPRHMCLGHDTCVLAQDTFFRNIFGAKNHTTGLIRVV